MDVNAVLARVDLKPLLDRVDVNDLMSQVDMDAGTAVIYARAAGLRFLAR